MAGRFIKLYEKLLDWRWFEDANTLQLFIYLLLKANYKAGSFHGTKVQRGQIITSLSKLGQATGQSIRQVRDNLKHLEMTGEVTSQPTNRYRIITIVRYDDYQSSDKQIDKQIDNQLDKQMTSNLTNKTAPSIEYIEHIEKNRTIEPSYEGESAKRFTPPTANEVFKYCLDNGYGIDVDRFMAYYNSNGWKVGRNPMKDWKAAVQNWYRRDKQEYSSRPQERPAQRLPAQEYHQRDYSDAQEAAFERMMALGGEDL